MFKRIIVSSALIVLSTNCLAKRAWNQLKQADAVTLEKSLLLPVNKETVSYPLKQEILKTVYIGPEKKITFVDKRKIGATGVSSFNFQIENCDGDDKSDMKIVDPKEYGVESEKSIGVIVQNCRLKILVENTELNQTSIFK